jgi:methylmalonyl-CoA mutase C-terminal domain/subunit
LFPRVIELLREKGAEDIVVFGGGIVPDEDIVTLKEAGVKEIFTPGSTTESVIAWVRENVRPRPLG